MKHPMPRDTTTINAASRCNDRKSTHPKLDTVAWRYLQITSQTMCAGPVKLPDMAGYSTPPHSTGIGRPNDQQLTSLSLTRAIVTSHFKNGDLAEIRTSPKNPSLLFFETSVVLRGCFDSTLAHVKFKSNIQYPKLLPFKVRYMCISLYMYIRSVSF